MLIEILGSFDKNKLYCAGSVTKFLTTFVVLSLLAEQYDLKHVLDNENFLDDISVNDAAKDFLKLFQQIIGSKFTLRDLCTYYTGLPYTFEPTSDTLEHVDAGDLFKHHSLQSEETFLFLCKYNISQIHSNRSKFHYSEISIIFLAYLIEKIYQIPMEALYQKYVTNKYKLSQSQLSRVKPKDVFIQDLSDEYDYAAIAVQDHGFYCYSNGFYTTLNDMKLLLESIDSDDVFHQMIDVSHARSAGVDLMNGLTVELKIKGDDLVYGYEGLSFSGCNAWMCSTNFKKGYLIFCNSENEAYQSIYQQFCYGEFDQIPSHTTQFYSSFIRQYSTTMETKDVPTEYQGKYQRVKINNKELQSTPFIGSNFLLIRDPDEKQYDLMYYKQGYYIKDRDGANDSKISFYLVKSGNRYMFFNGSLYRRVSQETGRSLSPQ